MKEFYLDMHDSLCASSKKDAKGWDSFCELNPERFLFFVGTKFFLITYHDCLGYFGKYDFKRRLVEKIIKDNRIFELYQVNSGVNVKDELRDFRLRNKTLRKHIQQVNYIYSDATGRQYAITTKTNFLESIYNQEDLDKEYESAKVFLEKNSFTKLLLPELERLYYENKPFNDDPAEYYKTIDHLVHSINKHTQEDGNDKKSKRERTA